MIRQELSGDKVIYYSEFIFENTKDFDIKEVWIEGVDGKKRSIEVEGRYQTADEQNRNGRVYSGIILERETASCNKMIKDYGALIGELDHPKKRPDESNEDYVKRAIYPNPERACGVHTNFSFDGKHVNGKSRILANDASHGQKVAELLKTGYKIGVSSRAVGGKPSLQGSNIVVPDDVKFITYDFVTNASNKASRALTTVINEGITFDNFDDEYDYWNNKLKQKPKKSIWSVLSNLN